MKWCDMILVIFGAALSLAISLGLVWLGDKRESRRVKKVLVLVLPEIEEFVAAFDGQTIMPTTEIPILDDFTIRDLIALPSDLGSQVRRLQQSLLRAEISRKVAFDLFENQESPNFQVHSRVYSEYLSEAAQALSEIKNILGPNKTEQGNPITIPKIPKNQPD